MINSRVLEAILEKPLGPYHDRDVLHETACQLQGSSKPVLYSFTLEHNGRVTGYSHHVFSVRLFRPDGSLLFLSLDESEHSLDGQDNRTFRFRGILKIANPGWLSDFGLKTVEKELNLRVNERALREGERGPPPFTLEDLFSDGDLLTRSDDATRRKDETRLSILIQGEKNLPAAYMRYTRLPDGLLWSSKAHNRNYQVATMDVETYSLSENFFWRWRLYALMEKIVKKFQRVAPERRTPIWFVEKYMELFACPPADRHRRLIFDEEDSDVDETGKTVTPRHLLRPHTSEILGLFAAHAEWLITNNEVKRDKLFHISSWEMFAKKVREERKEAARRGVRWGLQVGMEAEEESSDETKSDKYEDDDEKMVREHPVTGKANKAVVRKIKLARAKPTRETRIIISSSSESEGDGAGGAAYLSDFSESSDVEEHESDNQLEEEEAVDRIPWRLQVTPQLPDVDGRWWCPLRECNHHINLHELQEEERNGISEDLVEYILQKRWRNAAYDEQVIHGFKNLVVKHYLKHFEEQGVKVEQTRGKIRFTLINDGGKQVGGNEPIRGPMPARGTLGGESRVVPIVHALQAGHF